MFDVLFDVLFDEPFGGVEARNAESRLRRLARDGYGVRPTAPETAAEALRAFHRRFARDCATGALTDAGVAALLDEAFPG